MTITLNLHEDYVEILQELDKRENTPLKDGISICKIIIDWDDVTYTDVERAKRCAEDLDNLENLFKEILREVRNNQINKLTN